jgi:hypothetical protein
MPEASAAIEDVAHDDLCPVCTSSRCESARILICVDLSVTTVHSCKDAMQSSPLRLMHGPVGGCIIHGQHRKHRDLERRRRTGRVRPELRPLL